MNILQNVDLEVGNTGDLQFTTWDWDVIFFRTIPVNTILVNFIDTVFFGPLDTMDDYKAQPLTFYKMFDGLDF
jgi:hypothetical protein